MKYAVIIIIALIAIVINFRPKLIAERILKKDAENDRIIKIKLTAAVLCVIDFILALVWL